MTRLQRRRAGPSTRTVEVSHCLPDGTDTVVTVEVSVSRDEWGRSFDGEVLSVTTDEAEPKPLPATLVAWNDVADAAIEAAGEDERCEAEEAEARCDDAMDRARDDELTERYGEGR